MSAASGPSSVGFVEVPDFHVALARRSDPALAERPLLVGGDPTKRGKVVSASAELRASGIEVGMRVDEALARSPQAKWVATDLAQAREASGQLRAAVREIVPAVEIDGLAGFYFAGPKTSGEAIDLARRLEGRVLERSGLRLAAGFAPVRFCAPLLAADAGPGEVRVLFGEAFHAYLRALPIARLPGVGPKTAARLAELGASDVPGIQALGLDRLDVLLGNHGRSLWQLVSGVDPKPLRFRRHPETLSREETLDPAAPTLAALLDIATPIVDVLSQTLRREGLLAGRMALRLASVDGRTTTRSFRLEKPAGSAAELRDAVGTLLSEVDLSRLPVRRIGLVLKGLEMVGREEAQLDLF